MILKWIKAFRLRTLPLSLSGIILGSFYAKKDGFWDGEIFIFSILTTLFFQIVSNLANDLGDSQKGTDNDKRIGPARAIQSGEISIKAMKIAVIIFSVISLFSASILIKISSENMTNEMILFYAVLAIASVLSALLYTIGRRAYGYNGFGDIFVFVFFGLVSVMGSYTLYTKKINIETLFPAITIGLLSTAVLNLNNMRDRENDFNSGKITMVVKLGLEKAKRYHTMLILAALINLIFTIHSLGWFQFFFLIPVGLLSFHLKRVLENEEERNFDPELKKVALTTFLISILFAIFSSIQLAMVR
jgi:1,4-dihydroxy-2-naphthoate octaprenyltransferase